METYKLKGLPLISIKANTWYKDSHSLFDFESTKIQTENFVFPLSTKTVTFYRRKQSQQVIARQNEQSSLNDEKYQLLTKFEIQTKIQSNHPKVKLNFIHKSKQPQKEIKSDRIKTNSSVESDISRPQETYLIVKKFKDANGEPKGYKLTPGQTIKLGRVQYYVSEVSLNGSIQMAPSAKCELSRKVMQFDPSKWENSENNTCKICLDEENQEKGFLFNPCKCSGSCGTVHINCLMEWIHFKVKKEVVGGTLHYNFQKFDCEVCKHELPTIVDVNDKKIEMLPLEKPQGNYIILEGACDKSKSVMIIQNVPPEGIKLGRGHECEIRITDISVSRSHAFIKNINGSFFLFDNKSKFGSLVREENMGLEIGKQSLGIQIGRTTLSVEMKKEKEIKQ